MSICEIRFCWSQTLRSAVFLNCPVTDVCDKSPKCYPQLKIGLATVISCSNDSLDPSECAALREVTIGARAKNNEYESDNYDE